MNDATDTGQEVASALCAEWRMIASVSLRPCGGGDGFEADLRLDPIVVKGSLEQQGYPRTPAALKRMEDRRLTALEGCVRRINERLPEAERITTFSVIG